MSELKIKIGEEYKIKIEKGKDFESSIFNELYERASVNINDIIGQADHKRNSTKKSDFSILDDYNNIIAFTGDRGTGKSSSMVSFAEALINKKNDDVGGYFNRFDNILKKDFLSIEMIDPSLFVEKDTLLEIIISKMFLKFQKDLDYKNNSDLDYDKKRELITLFQKVFENLKTLHGDKKQIYDYEAIETLSKLANGTNLKENFNHLTEKYLEYFGINEGFLLIAIDDFDLNVKGAYFMLEDIRQYLIQKNIIILLASKMEQLQDSIKQSIINNYKELLQIDKENISDSPEKKSIKYLDKLFPIAHRINTPNIYSLFDSNESKIFTENNLNNDSNKFLVFDKNNNEIINSNSLEKGLLEYIFTNNDLFISKSKFYLSSIMPNTLRELSNFIGFLSISKNIQDLKNYFIIEIDNNLSPKYSSLFIELDSINISYVNQYIVNWLGKNHPSIIDYTTPVKNDVRLRFTDSQYKVDQIIKSTNNKNVTFADVLCLINQIEKESLIIESENIKLIYYLKLYFSIRYDISRENNSFYYLTNTLITNELIKIIPTQRTERKERHVFQIHQFDKLLDRLNKNELKIENYFWLSFFFGEIGKPDPRYRNDELVFYKTPINKTGNQYKEVRFNAFSFIVNCLEPNLVKERFLPENLWDTENALYEKIAEWKSTINEDYYIFFNIQFLDEFISLWRDYNFNYKKSIGNTYADAMQVYFSKNAFEYIFEEINKKYPYLKINIDVLYTNPILEYWRENLVDINLLLNDVFNSESDQEDDLNYKIVKNGINQVQRKILNDYITNLPKRKDKKSTLTRLIKKMEDSQFKIEYSNQISIYRSNLGNGKNEDEEIISSILAYLRSILLSNG